MFGISPINGLEWGDVSIFKQQPGNLRGPYSMTYGCFWKQEIYPPKADFIGHLVTWIGGWNGAPGTLFSDPYSWGLNPGPPSEVEGDGSPSKNDAFQILVNAYGSWSMKDEVKYGPGIPVSLEHLFSERFRSVPIWQSGASIGKSHWTVPHGQNTSKYPVHIDLGGYSIALDFNQSNVNSSFRSEHALDEIWNMKNGLLGCASHFVSW